MFKATSSRLSAAGKVPSHAELVDLCDMRTQQSSNIPSRIVIADTLVLFAGFLLWYFWNPVKYIPKHNAIFWFKMPKGTVEYAPWSLLVVKVISYYMLFYNDKYNFSVITSSILKVPINIPRARLASGSSIFATHPVYAWDTQYILIHRSIIG